MTTLDPREDVQSRIEGTLVARMIIEFHAAMRDIYGSDVMTSNLCAVGPLRSMIGLAIKNGHLAISSLPEQAATDKLVRNAGDQWQAELRIKAHLREHWLAHIVCDHEAKTDTAVCSCSQWRDEPHPSVGAAVDAWIEHVFTTLCRPSGDGVQAGRAEVIDLAVIEATARKINPGRSEDHIKSVALDALSIFRALNGGKNG